MLRTPKMLLSFSLCLALGPLVEVAQQRPATASAADRDEVIQRLERRVAALEEERATSSLLAPGDVEIGGQYRVVFSAANFGFHDVTVPSDGRSQSFVNQRFRTRFTVHPTDHVRGHLELEMGHIVWGDDFEFTKTFSGPRWPASTDPNGDRVGVEIRRAWLGFDRGGGTWRVGIQDRQDAFGQTLFSSDWDFNAGGVSFDAAPARDVRLSAAALALWEGDRAAADDAWMLSLDLDRDLSADRSVGGSLYFVEDGGAYSYPEVASYEDAWDLWLGVRGERDWSLGHGKAHLVVNTGERDDGASSVDHTGVLVRLENTGTELAGGHVDIQALWASGGEPGDSSSSSFRTVAQSARDGFGAQGYWSYLALTSPHGPSDVDDLGVSPQNRGLGLLTLQGRYRVRLGENWDSTTALGWLASDVDNPTSGASDMGVEVAETLAWDLGGGLRMEFGGAYLWTGDFYAASPAAAPDDLWQLFCRLQLEF